ncbi:MAG: hypothetical protein K2W95_08060 [Candidatus Obscuribacterales bacterium]|nr:hypothetical protein [Candidatus Obscuribacterales bacterium]
MSEIEVLVPRSETIDVAVLVKRLASMRRLRRRPFDEALLALAQLISERLFNDKECRHYPDLQALAFFMRRSALLKLKQEFLALEVAGSVLVPHGLVFHVPPANVDTIFVYSWLLSALCGNINVLRLSQRRSDQTDLLCRIINEALQSVEGMAAELLAVTYPHASEATAMISEVADVRVIWGGDRTVANVRAIPLAPHSRELVFPDRSSLALIKTEHYLVLSTEARLSVAGAFFNDAYWFDQMGCSSPRSVVWCGKNSQECIAPFWNALCEEVSNRGYHSNTAQAIKKMVQSYGAIIDDDRITGYRRFSPEITVLDAVAPVIHSSAYGAGLFTQCTIGHLDELANVVDRRDQTLAYCGFQPAELREFAELLNGRGIDRMVPFGQALQFGRFWDGYDLLRELVRSVRIEQ